MNSVFPLVFGVVPAQFRPVVDYASGKRATNFSAMNSLLNFPRKPSSQCDIQLASSLQLAARVAVIYGIFARLVNEMITVLENGICLCGCQPGEKPLAFTLADRTTPSREGERVTGEETKNNNITIVTL